MDNASTHRISEVRELYEPYIVILAELPLYSLDFNPIEHAFFILKA